jgi:DNA-binding MarR family transcriptional regulator
VGARSRIKISEERNGERHTLQDTLHELDTELATEGERLAALSPLERDTLTSLRRIIRAVSLYNRQLLKGYGLSAPQLTCLRHLGRHGQRTAGQLARGIAVSQATVTGIVDRLERGGLVARRRSEVDRRIVIVELTPRGREVATSVPQPLQERFVRGLSEVSEFRRQRIDAALKDIVGLMEATRVDAAPVLASGVSIDEDEELTHLDPAPLSALDREAG